VRVLFEPRGSLGGMVLPDMRGAVARRGRPVLCVPPTATLVSVLPERVLV
jgi:hypothetical protein